MPSCSMEEASFYNVTFYQPAWAVITFIDNDFMPFPL